jgi:hypothetical protein
MLATAALALLTLAQDPQSRPASAPQGSDFARVTELGNDELLFEVGVPVYRDPKGREVTLVSAVHVADAAHYQKLNELFKDFDAVLYELVGPEGARPQKGQEDSLLSLLQRALKNGLELEFQLDGIDYSVPNFVHADLDAETFARLMKERGESLLILMLRAMSVQLSKLREQAEGEPGAQAPQLMPSVHDMVRAFRNQEGRHLLRVNFARTLEDLEGMAAGFGGKDGSVLVEGRNQRAIEVLERELKAGRRRLAIYYGAAHMPDMEKRLLALGFTKTGEQWLVAWDVHKRKDKKRS